MWSGDKVDFVGHGGPFLIHKGSDFFLIKNWRWISRRISIGKAAGKRLDSPEGLCYEQVTPSISVEVEGLRQQWDSRNKLQPSRGTA